MGEEGGWYQTEQLEEFMQGWGCCDCAEGRTLLQSYVDKV